MPRIFDQDLPRNEANFAAMTPLVFLERAAEVYPHRLAVVHGPCGATGARCTPLPPARQRPGPARHRRGDTVAVMLPNTPPMVEAHFGVPMAGAVLNALNTRLDAQTIAFMLDHGEAKALIVDPEYAPVMRQALALRTAAPGPAGDRCRRCAVWPGRAAGQRDLRRIRGLR